eukprot:Lankesteria_metandrocarpae@DN4858_c0_g1_i2.p1
MISRIICLCTVGVLYGALQCSAFELCHGEIHCGADAVFRIYTPDDYDVEYAVSLLMGLHLHSGVIIEEKSWSAYKVAKRGGTLTAEKMEDVTVKSRADKLIIKLLDGRPWVCVPLRLISRIGVFTGYYHCGGADPVYDPCTAQSNCGGADPVYDPCTAQSNDSNSILSLLGRVVKTNKVRAGSRRSRSYTLTTNRTTRLCRFAGTVKRKMKIIEKQPGLLVYYNGSFKRIRTGNDPAVKTAQKTQKYILQRTNQRGVFWKFWNFMKKRVVFAIRDINVRRVKWDSDEFAYLLVRQDGVAQRLYKVSMKTATHSGATSTGRESSTPPASASPGVEVNACTVFFFATSKYEDPELEKTLCGQIGGGDTHSLYSYYLFIRDTE